MDVITIEELTQIADDFLRENYGLALVIPVERNNRLRTAMGTYIRDYDDTPNRIEVAGFMFEYAAREVIVDTLKHECVHYALQVRGKPFKDGDEHFEAELQRLGVSATETSLVGTYVVYACEKCGKEDEERGKQLLRDYKRWVTRCCRAELVIVGERIYDGTEAV